MRGLKAGVLKSSGIQIQVWSLWLSLETLINSSIRSAHLGLFWKPKPEVSDVDGVRINRTKDA